MKRKLIIITGIVLAVGASATTVLLALPKGEEQEVTVSEPAEQPKTEEVVNDTPQVAETPPEPPRAVVEPVEETVVPRLHEWDERDIAIITSLKVFYPEYFTEEETEKSLEYFWKAHLNTNLNSIILMQSLQREVVGKSSQELKKHFWIEFGKRYGVDTSYYE